MTALKFLSNTSIITSINYTVVIAINVYRWIRNRKILCYRSIISSIKKTIRIRIPPLGGNRGETRKRTIQVSTCRVDEIDIGIKGSSQRRGDAEKSCLVRTSSICRRRIIACKGDVTDLGPAGDA